MSQQSGSARPNPVRGARTRPSSQSSSGTAPPLPSRGPSRIPLYAQAHAERWVDAQGARAVRLTASTLGASILALMAVSSGPAAAQDTLTSARVDRPHLPGWSIAGDDGAGAMWANPANMALDPDPSWIALITQQADAQVDQGRSLAFAGNLGPLATGIHTTDGPDGQAWWTLSTGLALRLDRTVALGGHLGWQLPEGPDNNFMTGDLSLSWRPSPWFGASLAMWNVGRWDDDIARTKAVPGIVFRPWEDNLYLGVDYVQPMPGPSQAGDIGFNDGVVEGSIRVQAGSGWVVRLSGDQTGRVGAGLELYWGPAGVGLAADSPINGDTDVLATVYGRSPSGKRHKLVTGPRVAQFELNESFPYRENTGFFASSGETYLHLLSRLDDAANDPTLKGVVFEIKWAPFSFAQVEEIRGRIAEMRASGKKVVVYLDRYPDNRTYFLAAAADEIFLHPAGDLELIGLSAEMQYFRGALDILGIEPQVAKRAEYKSSPEGMMRTEGSGPAREQMNALLDDLSGHMLAAIAADRGWDLDHVRGLVDGGPYTADDALKQRLVDALVYPDEVGEQLDRLFTDRHMLEDDYANQRDTEGWMPRRELAVITIDGGIVSGESSGPGFFGGGYTAGADTIVRQLEVAASEDTIKAVVLRVDSPGGSSFASDEIWRAVGRVQDSGKPVVVSMGSVAASGGYYVAAGADAIYASPSTITGSIGVYAGPKFSLAGLYDKVGIGTEIYTRGRNAAMWSMSKSMDDHEFAALDRMVAHTYAQFKERVADGRSLDADQVEAVARGRVWSGADAQDGGLVDELGSFHDAVDAARSAAGIEANADVTVLRLTSRGGITQDVIGRPLGARTQPHPIASGLMAVLPTQGLFGSKLPLPPKGVPALAQLEQWSALADDRLVMLMPYMLRIQ